MQAASQNRSSTSSEGEFTSGASGLGVELHQQGTKRLHQTDCWSLAEAAPEGAQRIEERPGSNSQSDAASSCSSISLPHALPHLPGFGTDPSELHLIFARLFTPKHPSKLPRYRWVSYTRMLLAVQPFAPLRVYKTGPGNLKQLVIQWCQHHPAFAGLAQSAWCKRLKEHDQQALPGRSQRTVFHFCFEELGDMQSTRRAKLVA